jgi:hypothetical protein
MRIAVLICIVIFPCLVFSQKNSLGIYTSVFSGGSSFNITPGLSTAGDSITVTHTVFIGAEYSKGLNKWLKINMGIEYAKHDVEISNMSLAGVPVIKSGSVQYLSIPVYMRADVWKYVFFTFGLVFDLQAQSDVVNTNVRVGITGGGGLKYDFKNNLTVFLQPFYEIHGIRSTNLLTGGLRTGISYRF